MLSFAALALAAASPATSTDVLSTAPWWERITVTYGEDGSQRSCNYESSRSFGGAEACDPDGILNPGALRSRTDSDVAPYPVDTLSAKLPLEIDGVSEFVTARGDMFV